MAALGTPGGVVSDEDHRLALAGTVAAQTSTLAVRTGVMRGPGSTALVTGTAATGTMTVSVAPLHLVSTRGTADGVYLGTLAAVATVTIAAAPGSNSRIDVIYVKQNDSGSSVSPDGSTTFVADKATGTAAVTPTKPSIPVGAVEIATVTVASGATATNGAGVTITNTASQTVARGARVPVRNQAEEDALTKYAGLEVYRLDTGQVKLSNGTTFATTYDPAVSSNWVVAYESIPGYLDGIEETSWVVPNGLGPFSVTVPVGRTLEVEFSCPLLDIPAGTGVWMRINLTSSSAVLDAGYWSNSGSTAMGLPGRLRATRPGTGGSMTYQVEAFRVGSSTPFIKGANEGTVIVRHRIV